MNFKKKSFIIGGVLFEATPEKRCRYEVGYKRFDNLWALKKKDKRRLECEPVDEKARKLFYELNDLYLLRPLSYKRLSQNFKDYIKFISAGANREKMFCFESKNNGVLFIWAYIEPNTRELAHKGFILRGIKEEDFCMYYRGGIDKTAWFFHKNMRKKLCEIRRHSFKQIDLYDELDSLSMDEIERLLVHVEDEKTYDKISKYIDDL